MMLPHRILFVVLCGLLAHQNSFADDNKPERNPQSLSLSGRDSSSRGRFHPVNLIPCPESAADSNEPVNATLVLYSPQTKQNFVIQSNDDDAIDQLVSYGFNPNLPTMLYVHAFKQNHSNDWLVDARERGNFMLEDSKGEPTFNLLIFDWSTYSMEVYKYAASYVPNLGENLGEFLKKLAARYDLNKLHLVCYSLGSHIAALAGRSLPDGLKVGRLTALDAAGPCFFDDTHFGNKYVLRSSDAKLVVVKHYDKFAMGPDRPIGGLDIYVNGGGLQPGLWIPGINHWRASRHETQPFSGQCYEVAYACSSREAFLAGECGDCGENGEKCYYNDSLDEVRLRNKLGPLPNYRPNTTMFIETGSTPLCRHHYQLILQMKQGMADNWVKVFARGAILLKFNRLLEIEPTNYAGNDRYTALLSLDEKIEDVDQLDLKVRSFFSGKKDFLKHLDHIAINYLSHPLAEERAKRSFKICAIDIKRGKLGNCDARERLEQ